MDSLLICFGSCWNYKIRYQNHSLGTQMQLLLRLIRESADTEHAIQKYYTSHIKFGDRLGSKTA